MASKIAKAAKRARGCLEALYDGKCTVYDWQDQKQPSGLTENVFVPIIIDQPCRLSYSTVSPVQMVDGANKKEQIVKLFLAPEVNVPASSKIDVFQDGVTTEYKRSGQPAVYVSHQEITVELYSKRT